ncbi:hypothetical protein GH714_035065 [Hevea brasiliensis]|uniref:Uncharacterized protein n=1 Tax=Hevea brasiliensis TaxID=3981 RepID=A0A6A6LX59_HEVBR|nr:hypothetical protein GH714_035065 [Hevea brasiliensis]
MHGLHGSINGHTIAMCDDVMIVTPLVFTAQKGFMMVEVTVSKNANANRRASKILKVPNILFLMETRVLEERMLVLWHHMVLWFEGYIGLACLKDDEVDLRISIKISISGTPAPTSWCILSSMGSVGDSNEIFANFEKASGIARPKSYLDAF